MPNCCGCIDIRRGVIVIGAIGMLMSFVTLCLLFDALAEQGNILKNPKDENGKNLFSLVFVLGIIICFFKLLSDLLLIYGATIQTTKEVSVWLIINLCAILYIFANMVFLYVLLVGHETLIHKNTVLWIEVTIFMWNAIYIYLWHQVYVFSRQLYLDGRNSLEGIVQPGYNQNA